MRLTQATPVLALGLVACTPAITDDLYMPTVEVDLTTCGADRLQGLVGQRRAAVEALRLPQPVLLLTPDSPVPLDLVPERLVIEFLNHDTVTMVTCG